MKRDTESYLQAYVDCKLLGLSPDEIKVIDSKRLPYLKGLSESNSPCVLKVLQGEARKEFYDKTCPRLELPSGSETYSHSCIYEMLLAKNENRLDEWLREIENENRENMKRLNRSCVVMYGLTKDVGYLNKFGEWEVILQSMPTIAPELLEEQVESLNDLVNSVCEYAQLSENFSYKINPKFIKSANALGTVIIPSDMRSESVQPTSPIDPSEEDLEILERHSF